VPSLQANIAQGLFVGDEPLTFHTTLRGVVSSLDLTGSDPVETLEQRKHFDDRGFMAAGVHSSRGDYLFLAARGSRTIERLDTFNGAQSGVLIDVGYAPSGLALTSDDRFLLVDAALSREVVVYDVADFGVATEVARLATLAQEPLPPTVLRGKQLFNDSFDPRLAQDSYIACAHCHLDGESDHRVWDFTDRGEGLRNTISLLGRGGIDQGPIHWSANFDEVQDFEHDIRGPFGGLGLMDDDDWATHDDTLGEPKAGLSEDLDALAAYVESLTTYPRSPERDDAGALTASAEAGQAIFESPQTGCTTCHTGPALTDSAFDVGGEPILHDVGTLSAGSGQRLGDTLLGIDTPTLHGLWNGAPYLHDGSAATLLDVLTTRNPSDQHGTTSGLSAGELADLVAYLRSLEG
jgi:mono/diheme cytochrome c family protein